MPSIVAVHGIAQQHKGSEILRDAWWRALHGGIERVDRELPEDALSMAFYGDIFRPRGKALAQRHTSAELGDRTAHAWEREMLRLWWVEAARTEPNRVQPPAPGGKGAPQAVQVALRALSRSRFFSRFVESTLIGHLKQVRAYIHNEPAPRDPTVGARVAAIARVEAQVTDETRVLMGHSLGSVVAYEALAAHPEWKIHTLVTLGSPLGIEHLVFRKLRPTPQGLGMWPGGVRYWVNIAAGGDVVALVKRLASLFDEGATGPVEDYTIHVEGLTAHAIEPYLTAQETGAAVARGLGLL